jgi:hypothetical protein
MNSIKLLLISIIAAMAISTSARAGNLMAGTFAGNQDFTVEGSLRIFPTGSFFQSIFMPVAGTAMISFSAVCTTQAPGNAYTRVILLIDGVAVYPTDQPNYMFCSTHGPNNVFNFATYSFVVAKNLTAGNHDVQMHAVPVGPGAFTRIRQLSLTAWN